MLAQLYICNMDRHNMAEILQLPTPIKSSEDVKDYKLIQLPNGLKALLIQDTSYDLKKLEDEQNSNDESNTGLKKSAAGLCIGMYLLFQQHIVYETILIPYACGWDDILFTITFFSARAKKRKEKLFFQPYACHCEPWLLYFLPTF